MDPNHPNQIIVYHSRQEQEMDNFLYESVYPFIGNHWMSMLGVILVCIFLIVISNKISERRNLYYKYHKYRKFW